MSTKPMEFDEKAAHVAALNEGYDSNAYREHRAFEEGAKWQFTQLQSELEQKDAEIAELREVKAVEVRYDLLKALEVERARSAKLKDALEDCIATLAEVAPGTKMPAALNALKESGDE